MTLSEALNAAIEQFTRAGIETSRLDAEVLLARVLGVERFRLIIDPSRPLDLDQASRFGAMVARRVQGEPVAYITGIREFYSLDFTVTPDVLIPRPETELLVDLVLYYAPLRGSVLDLGTGSGAIAVAVKHSRGDLRVFASDVSPRALTVARENAAAILGKDAVSFHAGDMFAPFSGSAFDVIVSNPPYVDRAVAPSLQKELFHEPDIALFADGAGTRIVEKIIAESGGHLEEGGHLLVEIGSGMKDFVVDRGAAAGYTVSVLNDHAGLPRVAHFRC